MTPTLPPSHVDGLHVHAAALRHGLDLLLLPRQVLLASYGDPTGSSLAFAHGVPAASTVSAVTYAQDKRLRRALLQRSDVPAPRGATFSVRSLERAQAYAQRLGYPVTVKEAIGENPSRAIFDVGGPDELAVAFDRLRERDPDTGAPGRSLEIAGYAQTRLAVEFDEQGRELSPRRTRILIEEQVTGTPVRVLASPDRIHLAARVGPDGCHREVTAGLGSQIAAVARRAVAAVPGLAVATVDLRVDETDRDAVRVVELSERCRIDGYLAAGDALGPRIGAAVLGLQAVAAGVSLAPPEPDAAVAVTLDGLGDPDGLGRWLQAVCDASGITMSTPVADASAGTLTTGLQGPALAVAEVLEAASAGIGAPARVSTVEARCLRRDRASNGGGAA